MHLVKDRSCGECSVCCVALNVDTKEFQKLPGVACSHLCKSGGCAIHDMRYEVCRTYHCGWRYLDQLGDDWRPDRSGVLIDFQVEGLPSHYPKRPGVRLTLYWIGPGVSESQVWLMSYAPPAMASNRITATRVPPVNSMKRFSSSAETPLAVA